MTLFVLWSGTRKAYPGSRRFTHRRWQDDVLLWLILLLCAVLFDLSIITAVAGGLR